jgi:molybdenum cofactor guanylyltransferase
MQMIESYILIGGKSSRMGKDKFSLILNGKTFLEISVETLQKANLGKVFVVGNKSEPSAVADGLSLIKDIHQNRGALGGIHVALVNSKSEFTLILACDCPFVSVDLIEFLIGLTKTEKDFEAFAPIQKNGKIQPLCAIYKTANCRRILSKMLENSHEKYSVRDFLNQIKTRYIEFSEIAGLPNAENLFFNVNTPEDFEKAVKTLLFE